MQFYCSNCGRSYPNDNVISGTRFRCLTCDFHIDVPKLSTAQESYSRTKFNAHELNKNNGCSFGTVGKTSAIWDPQKRKIRSICHGCGKSMFFPQKKIPFNGMCVKCKTIANIFTIQLSPKQIFTSLCTSVLLLTLPSLLWAMAKLKTQEAESAKRLANMFGDDVNLFPYYFAGSFISYLSIYLLITLACSVFVKKTSKDIYLTNIQAFNASIIKFGVLIAAVLFIILITSNWRFYTLAQKEKDIRDQRIMR